MIYLVQLKCPSNHCIVASPYDPVLISGAKLEAELRYEMKRHGVRNVCGLCGSTDLKWEHRATPWPTLAQARAELNEEAARQRDAAKAFMEAEVARRAALN
jgi:hypothetical protein